MSVRVFIKRLVAVEINPSRSNQHEFNAGILRRELRLEGDPCKGSIEFLFYKADDADPIVAPESYTLYDARRNVPGRIEWRMYYTNRSVARHARVDDLMLLFRPDPGSKDLVAVIARQGTIVERSLVQQLAGREPEQLVDRLFVDSGDIDSQTRRLLSRALKDSEPRANLTTDAVKSHPLFERSTTQGRMPTTNEMASAAQEIVAGLGVTVHLPDDFIHMALEAETTLFMSIENELGNRQLTQLVREGCFDFHIVMKICTSYSQSRRSRRGQSLENHFRCLLQGLEIPHSYQCTTEKGRTPDFVIPSCPDYHDNSYPSEWLRMVGCKTRVRERHTQWLEEADRIPLKYALCIDDGLSDSLVRRYRGRLRFFAPQQLLDATYTDRGIRPLLGSIADLVNELRVVTGRAD